MERRCMVSGFGENSGRSRRDQNREGQDKRGAAGSSSGAVRVVLFMTLLGLAAGGLAQQPEPPGTPSVPAAESGEPSKAPGGATDNLAASQQQIAEKYARLEQLLIRMAELEATTNPQRAALLKRAAQQSSDRLTRQQLATLVKLLTPPTQLKRAIDDQQQTVNDLKSLLDLLQSEDRFDRLKREQDRVRDYIKEVDRLIRLQKGVQGRTEGGGDAEKLTDDQKQVADRTGGLAKRIRENEEGMTSDSEPKGQESPDAKGSESPSQAKSGESQKSNEKSGSKSGEKPGEKSGDKPPDKAGEKPEGKAGSKDEGGQKPGAEKGEKGNESSPGEGKDGQEPADGEPRSKNTPSKSKSGESKSGGSKSQEGEPSESSGDARSSADDAQQQENPARKRLQAAEDRMREAEKKLAEVKRDDAAQEQEKAREELEKAKAELEQILRQIREEEIERTLALLEGRFRRMLEGQLKIYESTKRLDKVEPEKRTRDLDLQASKLGYDETKLAAEADKALLLLREEGSSVAFPETVEMVRDDMRHVAERLSNAKVDSITQSVEEEIISALEELIAALQKAQQEMKEKRQQQQQMQAAEPGSRPLVDKLSELKMIRSLQVRVNSRTQRYSRLLEDVDDPVGRANDVDLRQSIIKLAELEQRVFEITRNIVLGRNE